MTSSRELSLDRRINSRIFFLSSVHNDRLHWGQYKRQQGGEGGPGGGEGGGGGEEDEEKVWWPISEPVDCELNRVIFLLVSFHFGSSTLFVSVHCLFSKLLKTWNCDEYSWMGWRERDSSLKLLMIYYDSAFQSNIKAQVSEIEI